MDGRLRCARATAAIIITFKIPGEGPTVTVIQY